MIVGVPHCRGGAGAFPQRALIAQVFDVRTISSTSVEDHSMENEHSEEDIEGCRSNINASDVRSGEHDCGSVIGLNGLHKFSVPRQM